jgi:hypothetical protein
VPNELDLLKGLGRELAEPDDESVARARALLEQRAGLSSSGSSRPRRRLRVRWAPAVATIALLIGSGLGFGIGASVTPAGEARGNVVGLGFIPADGWNVAQSGAIGETGVARAVAANVPIESQDESRELPLATLRSLPPNGVVIVARFLPRGDPAPDARFPPRDLPLRVSDAAPGDLPRTLAGTSVVPLRLRAAADGYNIDARVFVGTPLSRARLAAVDDQLGRMVVAPGRVTLVVQPTTFSSTGERMTIFGSVDSGKAGEKVTIQFKACGLLPVRFRDAFETTTQAGGGYSLSGYLRPFNLGVSGVYRAVAGDDLSTEVPVSQRASVNLRPLNGGRYEVRVWGKVSFWRRFVLLQRFERARGVWVTVRRLVLTEGHGATLPFRPGVPKGTLIRAVFPLSQARPCYLANVSQTLRV